MIATYATREDYDELNRLPLDMSYDEHMQTVRRIGELLAQSKLSARVAFQDIESGEYWRWITAHGVPDTRAARGTFADLKYHGKLDSDVDLSALKTE